MVTPNPIRVVVVDDHDVVRRGLSIFLRAFNDLKMIGQAANGHEAISVCEELLPDVVLMDLIMPEMDGIEATEIITKRFPQIHVIALTSLKDDAMVQKMLRAGAVAYILKNASIDELAQSIRTACQS